MFADHFAVIHCFEIEAVALFDVDVEVVAPKLDHDLVELTLAVDLAHECGLTQFIRNGLAVITSKSWLLMPSSSLAAIFKVLKD